MCHTDLRVPAHPENRPPLTEVHRQLRNLVPHAARHRVPDLEPEPDRVLPLPGWTPADEAAIVAAVREHVWPLIDTGRVRPIVDREVPMRDAAAGHRVLEESSHIGKVLLVTGE